MTHTSAELADEELVRRFQLGDGGAFEELVARWYGPLLHLAWRMTGDREEAKEIRQMALIQILQRARSFQGRSRFSTWLYRVCLNLTRDRQRRRSARSDALEDERRMSSEVDLATPLQAEERRETKALVAQAVLELPSEVREVVVLRHFHDLSFPAIAEITGAPETTVKSRMVKGLQRLRASLQHLHEEAR